MERRKPTIYIAGPMRGIEDFNFPAFDRQEELLKKQGWVVINPAELDRQNGSPETGPMEYDPTTDYEDREFMRDALKRDLTVIAEDCTAIYLCLGLKIVVVQKPNIIWQKQSVLIFTMKYHYLK